MLYVHRSLLSPLAPKDHWEFHTGLRKVCTHLPGRLIMGLARCRGQAPCPLVLARRLPSWDCTGQAKATTGTWQILRDFKRLREKMFIYILS